MRFNSPPNWPQPPAGWTPPHGWKPDPVWGDAPVGWPYWVDETPAVSAAPTAPPHAPGPEQSKGFWTQSYNQRHNRAAFGGVVLEDGLLKYHGGQQPVAGCHVRVESAGQIQSRVTATRLLTTGVFAFALKKKKDDRELYLTIEGQFAEWVVECKPKDATKARQFAAVVNTAARSQ